MKNNIFNALVLLVATTSLSNAYGMERLGTLVSNTPKLDPQTSKVLKNASFGMVTAVGSAYLGKKAVETAYEYPKTTLSLSAGLLAGGALTNYLYPQTKSMLWGLMQKSAPRLLDYATNPWVAGTIGCSALGAYLLQKNEQNAPQKKKQVKVQVKDTNTRIAHNAVDWLTQEYDIEPEGKFDIYNPRCRGSLVKDICLDTDNHDFLGTLYCLGEWHTPYRTAMKPVENTEITLKKIEQLANHFHNHLKNNKDQIKTAFKVAFMQAARNEEKRFSGMAVFVDPINKKAYCAWAGKCRAILCDKSKNIKHAANDHATRCNECKSSQCQIHLSRNAELTTRIIGTRVEGKDTSDATWMPEVVEWDIQDGDNLTIRTSQDLEEYLIRKEEAFKNNPPHTLTIEFKNNKIGTNDKPECEGYKPETKYRTPQKLRNYLPTYKRPNTSTDCDWAFRTPNAIYIPSIETFIEGVD